jgi:hypothetical protein
VNVLCKRSHHGQGYGLAIRTMVFRQIVPKKHPRSVQGVDAGRLGIRTPDDQVVHVEFYVQ